MPPSAVLIPELDRTCLAYVVSEPGEWTNALIWEDLGGPVAYSLSTVVHAMGRLKRGGLVDDRAGLRAMPTPPRVALFFDIDRLVLDAIRQHGPIKHAPLAARMGHGRRDVGKVTRKLARLGLIAPVGRLFPTERGRALFVS